MNYKQHHILVADDESRTRFTLSLLFKGQGIRVTTAENGHEAFTIFQRDKFDLIFSDFSMPGSNGLDLYQRVREIDPDVPFILFTAATFTSLPNDIFHLEKPARSAEILETVMPLLPQEDQRVPSEE